MRFHDRPWGRWEHLTGGDGYLVKKITVYPAQRLSLQSHEHRSEQWVCVQGEGTAFKQTSPRDFASIPGGSEIYQQVPMTPGRTIAIPKGVKHRLTNLSDTENLVIVETQVGDPLNEEDITRYDDDYGRA